MADQSFKRPEEKLFFVYDFTDSVGAASVQTVVAGTPSAVARDGGALIVAEGAAEIASKTVAVKWTGGVAGEAYLTTVTITDTAGETHTRTGEIFITTPDFAVPQGVAGRYLSAEDYAARFGTAELVRLTDEQRTGQADSLKLEAAIGDASDLADSYIATRYTIPLLSAPRVVKSIVADLARERLHKTRPTEEVKAAADRARTQLRDIAAGRMTLPIEQGGVVASVGGDRSSMTSRDRSSTYGDTVAGYSLNGGWFPDPCWRRL